MQGKGPALLAPAREGEKKKPVGGKGYESYPHGGRGGGREKTENKTLLSIKGSIGVDSPGKV